MKQTINEYEFIEAFRNYGRLQTEENNGNFTREGLRALFEYLEEYEASTGEELELDVITLCCDFSEYANWRELELDYAYLIKEIDADEALNEEEREALLRELEDSKSVLVLDEDEGHFIVGVF